MDDRESKYVPRNLEGLGAFIGEQVYMELRGEEPLLPDRREIAIKGTIVDVDEFSENPVITIQISLSHLATLSRCPIVPDKESQE